MRAVQHGFYHLVGPGNHDICNQFVLNLDASDISPSPQAAQEGSEDGHGLTAVARPLALLSKLSPLFCRVRAGPGGRWPRRTPYYLSRVASKMFLVLRVVHA